MINQVTLLGRVGKDPEIRYTPNNKAVCKFSLATNELKEKTTWHNITAWEKTAELCEQYVKKGDLLYIQGRIEYSEKDGKYYTAIVANTVKFLSSKGENSGSKEKPVPQPPQKQNRQPETTQSGDDLGDDDILF